MDVIVDGSGIFGVMFRVQGLGLGAYLYVGVPMFSYYTTFTWWGISKNGSAPSASRLED